MLSRRERDVLRVLCRAIRETGVAPSVAEIAAAIGNVSSGSTKKYIDGLERKGFIRRMPRRARAIEILRDREAFIVRTAPGIGDRLVEIAP